MQHCDHFKNLQRFNFCGWKKQSAKQQQIMSLKICMYTVVVLSVLLCHTVVVLSVLLCHTVVVLSVLLCHTVVVLSVLLCRNHLRGWLL